MIPNSVMLHVKVKVEMLVHLIDNMNYHFTPETDYALKEALDTTADKAADLLATINNCLRHYPAGRDM